MNKLGNNIFSVFQSSIVPIRLMRKIAITDAGIKQRAKVLQDLPELDELDIEEMEADFHNIGKSHKQHLRELDRFKEKEKFHIVKQKYFKEKWPNYLTWADKQQIKHLHHSNPEEWTVDKLSEGFPALPEIIQKLLKNTWAPKNTDRVKHHDETVQQNWLEYKKGNAEHLPIDLKSHLSKFTSRELNLNPNITEMEIEDVRQRQLVKKGGEFSQIIQRYETLKQIQKGENPQKSLADRNTNTSMIGEDIKIAKKERKSPKNKKLLTYEELQKDLVVSHNQVEDVGRDQEEMLDDTISSKEIVLKPEEMNVNIEKFKSADSQVNLYKPKREYANLMYPERIEIPKNKLKNGYTYKLNDCYYDSDGEFLYRVPGLQ